MKKHRPKRSEQLQTRAAGTREGCQAAPLPFVLPNKATRVTPWVPAYKQRTKFVPLLYSSIGTTECNQWQNLVQRAQLQMQIHCDTAQTEDILFPMRRLLWSAKAPPLFPKQRVLWLRGFSFFCTSTVAENKFVSETCTKAQLILYFIYTIFLRRS